MASKRSGLRNSDPQITRGKVVSGNKRELSDDEIKKAQGADPKPDQDTEREADSDS